MRNRYKKVIITVDEKVVPGYSEAARVVGIKQDTLRRRFERSKRNEYTADINGYIVTIKKYAL